MADVLGDAVKVYKKLLQESPQAQYMLKERGFYKRTIDHFDIGATCSPGKFYFNIKTEYEYTDDILEEEGLILTNGDVLETFRNSIIIPTKDSRGRVINITQRRLDDYKIKYLNLPHRPLSGFFGVEMLANRYRFGTLAGLDTPVFLCEGQMDTMTLQQLGFPALGVPGVNSMREVMFDQLRWFKTVVMCFDSDLPGQKGAAKMCRYIKYYYPDMLFYRTAIPDVCNDVNKFFCSDYITEDFIDLIVPVPKVKPMSFKRPRQTRANTDEKLLSIKELPIKDFVLSVAKQTQWTRQGHILKSKCPMPEHKDTVESFTIYVDSNTYFCFGCGCGGDVIDFCSNFFGTNFKTALNILSKWKDAR